MRVKEHKVVMPFETIVAPHVNVNDLEMIIVEWLVKPWQFVNKGEPICEVETTKSVLAVESTHTGYIYPLVQEKKLVKVGEPLAHVFSDNNPAQLEAIKKTSSGEKAMVSKKAQELMKEFGLTVADFPMFSTISSETVVAKIRELKTQEISRNEKDVKQILDHLQIQKNSVAIYGEKNQALLAMDAFQAEGKMIPVGYINSFYKENEFYGLPVISRETLEQLRKKGLQYIYVCGQDAKVKQEQEKECAALGLEIVSVIHPSASVSKFARLGKGVFIGAKAAIGPDVEIGDFSRVLCAATVAHHSKIGRFVDIADGSHLGGNVTVGDFSLIGIGVNINKRITIGKNTVIVSGATVIDHVPDNSTVRLNIIAQQEKSIT